MNADVIIHAYPSWVGRSNGGGYDHGDLLVPTMLIDIGYAIAYLMVEELYPHRKTGNIFVERKSDTINDLVVFSIFDSSLRFELVYETIAHVFYQLLGCMPVYITVPGVQDLIDMYKNTYKPSRRKTDICRQIRRMVGVYDVGREMSLRELSMSGDEIVLRAMYDRHMYSVCVQNIVQVRGLPYSLDEFVAVVLQDVIDPF